jgi:hypothetical protein
MYSIISFCAEGIIRDSQTNNISAYNILENINSPGFPLFIPNIFFFSLLEKKNTEPNINNFTLTVSNNKQSLLDIPISSDFQDKHRCRQIVKIGGIAVPSPGLLTFKLLQGKKELCSYSVRINKIGGPEVKKIE